MIDRSFDAFMAELHLLLAAYQGGPDMKTDHAIEVLRLSATALLDEDPPAPPKPSLRVVKS